MREIKEVVIPQGTALCIVLLLVLVVAMLLYQVFVVNRSLQRENVYLHLDERILDSNATLHRNAVSVCHSMARKVYDDYYNRFPEDNPLRPRHQEGGEINEKDHGDGVDMSAGDNM